MKILLVTPTFHYRDNYPTYVSVSDFPMGFAYIASSLKQAGHEVIGLNPNNDPNYHSAYDMLEHKIKDSLKTNPDLIGLGGICTDYTFLRDAIGIIRENTKTPIVLGGGIVNNDAEFIFKLLKPDYAIVGEAEETVVQLANSLQTHSLDHNVNNLWYWNGNNAESTKISQDYPDVNSRPFPDFEPFGVRELLDKYSMATRVLYRYSRPYPRPFVILTARGCCFNCDFCIHRGTQHYRARSIENIMAEIKENYDKYKFNILIVVDELFAVNKKRMTEFCEALLDGREKYGWDFDWMFQTHANAKLDLESLKLARKTGCYFFSYGLESASPTVLEAMNKKTKIPQLVEAIKLAREADIGFGGNLIFGDPAETEETIKETMEFFFQNCYATQIFLAFMMPYPGSKVFDICVQKGIIRDKKVFYENIDKGLFNMTTMPDNRWQTWINFLATMEQNWMWVKQTDAISIEEDTDPITDIYHAKIWKVTAVCPYCGKEIIYREVLHKIGERSFMGTGCTHCNQRIRINLKVPVRELVCQ